MEEEKPQIWKTIHKKERRGEGRVSKSKNQNITLETEKALLTRNPKEQANAIEVYREKGRQNGSRLLSFNCV